MRLNIYMYLSQNPKLLHVSLCHWIYTLKESSLSLEVPQRAQLTTATAKIFIDKNCMVPSSFDVL